MTRKSYDVLVIHRTTWESSRSYLRGVFRYAAKTHNWNVRLVQPPEISEDEIIRAIEEDRPDGIIAAEITDRRLLQTLADPRTPLVYSAPKEGVFRTRDNAVFFPSDSKLAGYAAAKYLLGLGSMRSWGYVGDPRPDAFWSVERGNAFREALREKKVSCSVFPGTHPAGSGHDRKELAAWLDALPKPAAIFAAWDYRALQVIEACRNAGVRIPQQVMVLGVDNDRMLCELAVPRLSSIDTGLDRIGYEHADRLDKLMHARPAAGLRPIREFPAKIVERESTAPVSPAANLVQRALAYIDAEACSGISLTDVVKHLGVSRRLATMRFREFENRSIQQAIIARRLEEAKRLLTETDNSVKSIAAQCCFSDPNRLSTLFRRATGRTMRDWRKNP